MVIFDVGEDKRHDMHAHFAMAARVAEAISKTFRPPNELEFEKCYYPYLLFSKKRYAGELPKKKYVGGLHRRSLGQMNSLARALSVYLLVVFADALLGFGLYRKLVQGVVGAFCFVTNRHPADRRQCEQDVFFSRTLWMLIAAGMGVAGGYVTLQALKTGKF